MRELSRLLSTTNPKGSKLFFLIGYAPIPKVASLHLVPPPLSTADTNSFKTTDIFLPQTVCMQEPISPRPADMLLSPSGPAAGGLYCMAQHLVLFLASMAQQTLHLEKVSAVKVFV